MISALLEELAAVEVEEPGERQRRQDSDRKVLELPPPPVGAESHNLAWCEDGGVRTASKRKIGRAHV